MLIRCPQCSTAFNVPTSAIGEAGRKVKCTKCSHIWFQEPLRQKDLHSFLNIEERLKPLDDVANAAANLPARMKSPFNWGKLIFATFLIGIFFVTIVLGQYYNYPVVKNYLQMERTDGLRFSDFTISKTINDNKYEFNITGFLINTSHETKRVPKISLEIQTKSGRILDSKKLKLPQSTIAPATQIYFNSKISGISGNAYDLELILANPWERALN
jgi:predicted Zn finger-like uncharacterized protein